MKMFFTNRSNKMRIYRDIAIISLGLVLVMSFSGVMVHADNGNVDLSVSGTITVMMSEAETDLKPYHAAFMRKYPQVTVKYVCLSDYENEIVKKIDDNSFGDVIYMPSYLDADTLQSKFAVLGTYDELAKKYNYVDKGGRVDNNIYSIPSNAYLAGIIYNKDVFYRAGITETPKTMEDFIFDLGLIKETKTAVPLCSYFNTDWALFGWGNFPYIEMTGDANYKTEGFIYEENPFSVGTPHYQVYQFLHEIVANGLVENPAGSIDWDNSKKMLNQGKLGCVVVGSWALHQFKEAGSKSDSIGFMPFPNEINGQQYATVLTNYCYGINKNSTNVEAAKAYLNFMLDESGYAVEQDRISILKTDILPESYNELQNVNCMIMGAYTEESYQAYEKMSQAINPDSVSEIKRIIASGLGGKETFDDIMADWNARWEGARPKGMKVQHREKENSTISADALLLQQSDVDFSEKEQDYINDHQVLRVGYLEDMAPFQFTDKNGDMKGVAFEVLDTISESTGMKMEYYPYSNSEKLVFALNSGELDVVAGIEDAKAAIKRVKYSKPYISYSDVIVRVDTIDKSKVSMDTQVILVGETSTKSYLDAKEYIFADNMELLLKKISSAEADFAIVNCYSADYYLDKYNKSNLATVPLSGEKSLCLAFPLNADYQLIAICNKSILNIPDSTIQMSLLQYMDYDKNQITLLKIIKTYPIQFVVFIVVFFCVIVAVIQIIHVEKKKHFEKQSVSDKKYEILSKLMEEYIFDYDFVFEEINLDKKFEEICRYSGVIRLCDYQKDNDMINTILENCQIAKNQENYTSDPFQYVDSFGNISWYQLNMFCIESKGLILQKHIIGKVVNVQEEVEKNRNILKLAERDSLTGLYNRTGFAKNFTKLMDENLFTTGVTFAILDFDDFKSVNDILGHNGGDEALKQLATELRLLYQDNLITARYGGDEFLVCAFGIDKQDAQIMYEELVKSMDRDINYQTEQKHVSISLGAIYTKKQVSYEELFIEADKALYDIKARGKNAYLLKEIE